MHQDKELIQMLSFLIENKILEDQKGFLLTCHMIFDYLTLNHTTLKEVTIFHFKGRRQEHMLQKESELKD